MKETLLEYLRSKVTFLPVSYIEKIDGHSGALTVKTPVGIKLIELKKENINWLGTKTNTDKTLEEIINEIRETEEETKDFLVKRWLETMPNETK